MSFFTKHIYDPGPKVTPANSNNKETGENVPETTNSLVSQAQEIIDNSEQVVKIELSSKYLNYLEQLNIGKEGITYKDFRKILNKLRLKITDDEQAFNTAWISYTSIGGSESIEDLTNSLGDFVIALKKDSTLFETSVDEVIKKEKEPCFSEINSYEKCIHEIDAQIEILQKERGLPYLHILVKVIS